MTRRTQPGSAAGEEAWAVSSVVFISGVRLAPPWRPWSGRSPGCWKRTPGYERDWRPRRTSGPHAPRREAFAPASFSGESGNGARRAAASSTVFCASPTHLGRILFPRRYHTVHRVAMASGATGAGGLAESVRRDLAAGGRRLVTGDALDGSRPHDAGLGLDAVRSLAAIQHGDLVVPVAVALGAGDCLRRRAQRPFHGGFRSGSRSIPRGGRSRAFGAGTRVSPRFCRSSVLEWQAMHTWPGTLPVPCRQLAWHIMHWTCGRPM